MTNSNTQKRLEALKVKYIEHLTHKNSELKEKWPASNAEDLDYFIIEIHSIAGTSGIYSLPELAESASQLEAELLSLKKKQRLSDIAELNNAFDRVLKEIESITAPSCNPSTPHSS